MNIHVAVRSARSDREAIQAVVGLSPPAVENGKIEAAVQDNFLTAGAGGLERPPRIVQPHVNALHEVAPHVDVVVLDEDKFIRELFCRASVPRFAAGTSPLAGSIVRMRLSRENGQLHRTIRLIVHHRG